MEIREVSLQTLFEDENFWELSRLNHNDNSSELLSDFRVNMVNRNYYLNLQFEEKLFSLGCYKNDKLVGYAVVNIVPMPKYSTMSAVIETIYLHIDYRKGRDGLKLIDAIKNKARDMKSTILLASVPVDNKRLYMLLSNLGFSSQNWIMGTKL